MAICAIPHDILRRQQEEYEYYKQRAMYEQAIELQKLKYSDPGALFPTQSAPKKELEPKKELLLLCN